VWTGSVFKQRHRFQMYPD